MAVLHLAALIVIGTACGSAGPSATTLNPPPREQPVADSSSTSVPAEADRACADVVGAEIGRADDGSYRVAATVSSPDTGEEKYADAWRITTMAGEELGVRILTHPHVDEQPFTRSLTGVAIPAGVEIVRVEARDSVEGYCGESVVVSVP